MLFVSIFYIVARNKYTITVARDIDYSRSLLTSCCGSVSTLFCSIQQHYAVD